MAVFVLDHDQKRRSAVVRALSSKGDYVVPAEDILSISPPFYEKDVVLVFDHGDMMRSVVAKMTAEGGAISIIAYQEGLDPDRIVDAISIGACDYFIWPLPESQLLDRVKNATLRPSAIGRLNQSRLKAGALVQRLSERETQVLDCIAEGLSAEGIGRYLDISLRTVEAHKRSIKKKFGACSSFEVIRLALANASSASLAN